MPAFMIRSSDLMRTEMLQKILRCIADSKNRVVVYQWWGDGVGLSTAAKAVAKKAEESYLFEEVVLARAGKKCSPRKLQKRIAEQLKINYDDSSSSSEEEEEDEDDKKDDGSSSKEEEEDDKEDGGDGSSSKEEDEDDKKDDGSIDEEVSRRTHNRLVGRSFLLIVDNLVLMRGRGIELGAIGIPAPSQWSSYHIFITTPNSPQQLTSAVKPYSIVDKIYKLESEFPRILHRLIHDNEAIEVEELLERYSDEAGDLVTSTIGSSSGHVCQGFEIFNCFMYLCLFQKAGGEAKEISKYYVGEGFVPTFKAGEDVLRGMIIHRMVERRMSPHCDAKICMNSQLWEILKEKKGMAHLKRHYHIQLEAATAATATATDHDHVVMKDDAKWIALPNINNIQKLLQQQQKQQHYKNPQLSTLLLNHNPHLAQIPDDFFLQIPNLKVLDLSRTSISSLPESLSCLQDLRFLKLRECSSLTTFPTFISHLKELIILDLHATPISNIPNEAFQEMLHLRLLDLSHTNIKSLPSSLFSSLCNLEQLFLGSCGSLDVAFDLPSQLRQLSALEEVDISGCGALKDAEDLQFEDMRRLRFLNLCDNTKMTRLSLRRCQSLEIVHLRGLTNLNSLHLSATDMKEFPHDISKLRRLEQLLLTDVRHLERVDWKKVDWLPRRLEWEQCGRCSSSRFTSSSSWAGVEEQGAGNREEEKAWALISVSNANIFRGLAPASPIWDNCFSKFHIYISPCSEEQHKKKEKDVKRRRKAAAGIYSKIKAAAAAAAFNFDKREEEEEKWSRVLEMEGVDDVGGTGKSIKVVVAKAEVVWLRENEWVKSVKDIGVGRDGAIVKECRVERCHNMEFLFPIDMRHRIEGLKGRLWVSDMRRLRSVYDGGNDFSALQYFHIHFCPNLRELFGYSTRLLNLKTLDVKFCCRLEHVFYPNGLYAFPQLRNLHLWELPKLYHICGGSLPCLQNLRVRACPKLRRLPQLPGEGVKIEGEEEWWSNLEWDNQWRIEKDAIQFQSTSNPNI